MISLPTSRRFNPCFTGCCSSTMLVAVSTLILCSFNPCFTGCCSSTTCWWRSPLSYCVVSILVLLDVALQQTSMFVMLLCAIRFNPCFTGCCSSTFTMREDEALEELFQSLFYWMLLFNNQSCDLDGDLREFQSLFYWMLLFNYKEIKKKLGVDYCFNPCFTGCCSSTFIT